MIGLLIASVWWGMMAAALLFAVLAAATVIFEIRGRRAR